jgi:hypothetical protein
MGINMLGSVGSITGRKHKGMENTKAQRRRVALSRISRQIDATPLCLCVLRVFVFHHHRSY